MSQEDNFRTLLGTVVQQNIDGCVGLASVERLSGGASQETYRLRIQKANGEERNLWSIFKVPEEPPKLKFN